MRLTNIKISGFKSFVDKTEISLSTKRTGIIGPNGCGKSNIIDAVKWVLGETSKHIRGDSIDDVIFNGTDTRQPNDYANVELFSLIRKIELAVNMHNMTKFQLKERLLGMARQSTF